MHPILAYRGRMGPYLAAWVPLGGLLAGLLVIAGSPWGEAAAIAFPMAIIYGFICLAAWYPCKSASPHAVPFLRVITTQVMAAAVSAMLWLFLVDTWVVLLEQFPVFSKATERFPRLVPVILAVGVVLYALAAALHYLLMAFEEARQAERSALELEVLAREAELRSLRAQIDPHFLFNALNSISSLTGSDPAAARAMCLELADFLRESLRLGAVASIPLADELALAEKYLAVERVRFGSRLRVEREVSAEAGACGVPPLVLQPLVENAVTARGREPGRRGRRADRGAPAGRAPAPHGGEPDGPRGGCQARGGSRARQRARPPGRALRPGGERRGAAGRRALPGRARVARGACVGAVRLSWSLHHEPDELTRHAACRDRRRRGAGPGAPARVPRGAP